MLLSDTILGAVKEMSIGDCAAPVLHTAPHSPVSAAIDAAKPYAPSVLGAGALGVASYLIVRKLTSGSAKAEAGAEAEAAPPGGIVPRAKKAATTALAAMAATFPRAMQEEAFMKAVSQELSKLGFKRDNCIALVSTCRDEVCRPVVSLVDQEFGLSFNIAGLGGVLNCGSTGFKAAMSHSPEFRCETDGAVKERYIFFAFPHVSIGESGEVGSLLRRGRGKPSSACGALIAIQNDINAGKATVSDPYDEEYVLLKKKVKSLGLTYLTLLLGFYMAWNIGANDVANAMGTSVGSGALTLRQAVLAAAILEFGGAFLVGSHVSHTMQNGIIKANVFAGKNAMLFTGMISSLAAAGTWLQVASYFGWPVSTTHCIIGAMVGFGIIFGGWNAVYWSSLARVVSSWVVSPLLGASIAFIVYKCIRK
ncbi:unnamed protein product, partial [Closterium sp. NIES-53]